MIKDRPLEVSGWGENGLLCASFSLVSSKEKDALFLKNRVWLSISSQELRPSVLLDTRRLGTVCQTMVAMPNEISHLSREAGWVSSTCVVQISAGQPATPYSAPARSTAQSRCHEVGNWQRWRPLFHCSALHQMIPSLWISFGTLSKRVSSF